MNSKLLPRPFCGDKAQFDIVGDSSKSTQISCNSCGCSYEDGSEWSHEIEWNTRYELAPKGKQLVSDKAISFLFDNHRDIYDEFYKLI